MKRTEGRNLFVTEDGIPGDRSEDIVLLVEWVDQFAERTARIIYE